MRRLYTCHPDDAFSYGGAYSAGCIDYNITTDIDVNQNFASPPWKRLEAGMSDGQCEVWDSSRVQSNFWRHISPAFCAALGGRTPDDVFERLYNSAAYRPRSGNMKTPPPDPNMYPPENGNPWRFHFWYEPSNKTLQVPCHMSCQEAYDRLADYKCE